jgi:predicted transcriptional regulator
MKAGRPKDAYNVFPKRNSRGKMVNNLRRVCNGIKARIRKEKDPEKKRMWAIIGLELNELLLTLE